MSSTATMTIIYTKIIEVFRSEISLTLLRADFQRIVEQEISLPEW